MKYNHLRLFKQMMDQGVDQQRVITYFQAEGYSEEEILSDISQYEREKEASASLRAEPVAPAEPATPRPTAPQPVAPKPKPKPPREGKVPSDLQLAAASLALILIFTIFFMIILP